MPRSLILHIGTMKTGSTTIQALLSHNRAALRDRGICYPRTGGLPNHLLLAFKFSSRQQLPNGADAVWGGRKREDALDDACARFQEEIAALPPEVDRVILSNEMFSQFVSDTEDIVRLRDFLAPYFDHIDVLIYLRRQDAHIASGYSQLLRRGLLSRPSLVLWKNKEAFNYDYDKLLSPWAEVFGEAAIKPRIFERDTNKSWDAVEDFIEVTGTGPLPAPRRIRRNPSINVAGQRALREIGWILKGDDESQSFAHSQLWRRLIGDVTKALPGRGWQPHQAEARDFVARFAASNERVRRRWLPERESLFSDDYSQLPEKILKPAPDEDLRAVTTVLISVVREALEREEKQQKRIRRTLAVRKALRRNKDDAKAGLELARLTMEAGELDSARRRVERLLKLTPGDEATRELAREIEAQAAAEETAMDLLEMSEVEV